MRALPVSLIGITLAACAPPAAEPAHPVVVRAAVPPSRGASCTATIGCYQRCRASDLGCMAACDRVASLEAHHASRGLLDCLALNNCRTQMCAEHSCGDQLGVCGMTLAVVREPLVTRATPP